MDNYISSNFLKAILDKYDNPNEKRNYINSFDNKNNKLIIKKENDINIVWLENSERMNSMNLNVAIEFYNLINRKTQKDFFIFKGDDKNQLFCSGLDLKFFYEERDNQHKLNTFSDLTY